MTAAVVEETTVDDSKETTKKGLLAWLKKAIKNPKTWIFIAL